MAPSWSHDVFISFRGEDSRKSFAVHLYNVLHEKGINAFMDDQGLSKGEEIRPSLMTAIQESRTAIVIFSENYASSTYCLEELAEIMDHIKNKGRLVWPIFYHVDPSDVRKQKGKFGEALAKHETNIKVLERVETWRLALQEAANLRGWNLTHELEHELIQEIIQEVSREIYRNKNQNLNQEDDQEDEVSITPELKKVNSLRNKTQAYSKSEIFSITRNLKTKIGDGGFGNIYLGTLDGTQVAVELLSLKSQHDHKEFQSEVELLSSLHHRNLVSPIGYCNEGDVKALIYEYMDNGNLRQKLSEENPNVSWTERLGIAVDTAQGLDYLHNGCRPPIIFRNLTPANILLNANMQAKIADFSVARAFADEDDDTRFQNAKKVDIYSFGIILFYLITGQPVIKKTYSGKVIQMRDWLIPEVEKGGIENILDQRLNGNFRIQSVQKTMKVAMSCISQDTAQRPEISHVLAELKECLALEMEIAVGHQMGMEFTVYSYPEILRITENLKKTIGEGGFGKVYLGTLHDTQVAVKLLSLSSNQGLKEFKAEVEHLKPHENLVSLIGYCDGDFKALIYEYMENGDLKQKLSEKNLEWTERLQIAIHAAQGLDYLHNGCRPPIIHRDLKPANILLNANMEAKIADFGLSRAFANDNDTHVVTSRAGTMGYLDPLFRITKKSDIYSFGVILFELITGQPAIIKKDSSGEEIPMRDWVVDEIDKGHILNIIDRRLDHGNSSIITSVKKAIDVARPCISLEGAQRPDISHVLAELKKCLALENNTNGMGSSQA